MSTDIEQRVRAGLADTTTPADLRLDADTVTRVASRSHRRRRTGQALLGGMASLAVLGAVTWAGGWLPGGVQRVLPASPLSSCPISDGLSEGPAVRLADLDHAVIPLADGGTVVAGLAQGCSGGDAVFMAATPEPADALPERVPMQGGLGVGPDVGPITAWWQGLQMPEGRQVTGVMVPGGASKLVTVGPDAVHEPSSERVSVPGTDLDAYVFEDYWPDGEDLAQVWRGSDGLVHTSWSAGTTARVWQGSDPGAKLTDTWVGQDRQEQLWVMRDGEVQGPLEVSTGPWAVAFPTDDPDTVEVVVVVPEDGGELSLADDDVLGVADGAGSSPDGRDEAGPDDDALKASWLGSSEGDRTLHAALITLELDEAGVPPALEWTPAGEGVTSQPVVIREP